MFGFNKNEVGKDPNFKDSIFEKLGLSEYLCPDCNAHLKESEGELICLNACHLPKHWQKRFSSIVNLTAARKEKKEA